MLKAMYGYGCSISETSASFDAYLTIVWKKDWEYAPIMNY